MIGSQREEWPGTSQWLLGVDSVDRKQRLADDDICTCFPNFPATKKDVTRKLKSHFNQLRSVFRGRAMLAATTVGFFLWGPALQVAVVKSSWNARSFPTNSVVKALVTVGQRHLNRTWESTLTNGLTSRLQGNGRRYPIIRGCSGCRCYIMQLIAKPKPLFECEDRRREFPIFITTTEAWRSGRHME